MTMQTIIELMLADLGLAQLASVSGLFSVTLGVKTWMDANQ